MSTMRIPIRFGDRLRSQRGSARTCLIATAAQRTWGGSWTVNHKGAERTSDDGQVMSWRPSAGAHLVMSLSDAGLPVPVRSVKLVRGRARPGPVARPGTGHKAPSPAVPGRRGPRARKVAAGAAAAGVLALVISEFAWLILALIGAVAAVLTAVIVRNVRAGAQAQHVPGRTRPDPRAQAAPQPAVHHAPLTRPEPPRPEPKTVPNPMPKTATVPAELPLERAGDRR
ncbi:MAG: hypothetical protein ACRDOK_25125 [Streptosporangiaceae bacterium]